MACLDIRPAVYIAIALIIFSFSCGQESEDGGGSVFIEKEIEWRAERVDAMRDSTSWLTITGLFWLKEGTNSLGSSPENSIVLRAGSSPAHAGRIIFEDDRTVFEAAEGVTAFLDGDSITGAELISDAEGEPGRIQIGGLSMWIIERGGRFALRVRDFNAPALREFENLDFYPPKDEYLVRGSFVPYEKPRMLKLSTVVGTETEMPSPGYASFRLKGKELKLELIEGGSDSYFIIFRDLTSGKSTYGACRFMSGRKLSGDSLELNFNRAVNPPCAYTPFATCPLPPDGNHLPVRIEAGEKKYPGLIHKAH